MNWKWWWDKDLAWILFQLKLLFIVFYAYDVKMKNDTNKLNILINSNIIFLLTFDLIFNDTKLHMMNGMNWFEMMHMIWMKLFKWIKVDFLVFLLTFANDLYKWCNKNARDEWEIWGKF